MTTFHHSKVHHHQLTHEGITLAENDKNAQSENIVAALKEVNTGSADVFNDQHITISCRSKDDEGQWFSCVITPLDLLKDGDEIILNTHGLKLVVSKNT